MLPIPRRTPLLFAICAIAASLAAVQVAGAGTARAQNKDSKEPKESKDSKDAKARRQGALPARHIVLRPGPVPGGNPGVRGRLQPEKRSGVPLQPGTVVPAGGRSGAGAALLPNLPALRPEGAEPGRDRGTHQGAGGADRCQGRYRDAAAPEPRRDGTSARRYWMTPTPTTPLPPPGRGRRRRHSRPGRRRRRRHPPPRRRSARRRPRTCHRPRQR